MLVNNAVYASIVAGSSATTNKAIPAIAQTPHIYPAPRSRNALDMRLYALNSWRGRSSCPHRGILCCMEPWLIALIVKPFALLAVTVLVLYPATLLARRYIPEGRLKRLLLATPEERKVLFTVSVILFYVCFFTIGALTLRSL